MNYTKNNGSGLLAHGLLPVLTVTVGLFAMTGCDDDDSSPSNEDTTSVTLEGDEMAFFEVEVPEEADYFEIRMEVTDGAGSVRVDHPTGTRSSSRTEGDASTFDFDEPSAGVYGIEVSVWEFTDDIERTSVDLEAMIEPDDLTVEIVPEDSRGEATLATSELDVDSDSTQGTLGLIRDIVDTAAGQGPGTVDYGIERDGESIGTASVHRQTDGGLAIALDLAEKRVRSHGSPVTVDAYTGDLRAGQLRLRTGEGNAWIRLGDDTGTHADVEMLTKPGYEVDYTDWEAVSTDGLEVVRD